MTTSHALSLTLGVLLLPLITGIAEAGTIIMEEVVFDDLVWDQSVQAQGNGGTASRIQVAGGNPGSSAEVTISLNTPGSAASGISSAVWFFSIGSIHSYDPSAGGILSIDFFEDAILLTGQGNGHATSLALRQDGVLYLAFARRLFTPERDWTSKSILDLVQSDFRSIASAANPDFSSNGSPIEFGYVRGNSSPPGSSAALRITGIDNWRVELTTAPEPGTATLVGLGLVALVAGRRSVTATLRRPAGSRAPMDGTR